jgi:hypothetical protein
MGFNFVIPLWINHSLTISLMRAEVVIFLSSAK